MSDLSSIFGSGFQTDSIAPATDFEPLAPGKYPVIIEAAEVKATKAGNGHFLELRLSVLDGPAKNRKLWERLNIDNPNQQAVEIALRSLAALGQALGLATVSATEQLVNGVCIAHVKVDKDNSNSVRTYSPAAAVSTPVYAPPPPPVYQAPTQQTATAAAQPAQVAQASGKPPTPATAGRPPWARG